MRNAEDSGQALKMHFFDVRVFNPLASSHQNTTIQAIYKSQEQEKKRAYDQRVREVKYGSFTPLVMSITGGMHGPISYHLLPPTSKDDFGEANLK